MSLLEDIHKSFKGLVGYEEPKPPQLSTNKLGTLYAQQRGVMSPPDPIPRESPHYQDMYTPNENLGDQVHQTYGSPKLWNEFADQTLKTFKEFGLKVDRKKLFPTNVHLSSSEGRDIPYGKHKTKAEADFDRVPYIPRDWYEREWLNKDANANISPIQHPIDWELKRKGLLEASGLMRPSIDSVNLGYNSGDNSYLGVSRQGAIDSRGIPSEIIEAQAPNFERQMSQGYPPRQNVTGHEYGHYIDVWMGKGESLSKIAMSLNTAILPNNRSPTPQDWYEAWMNDDRTKHLDVVDKINTADHPNEKLNNPREILGKLYVTAMLNPNKTDGTPFGQRNMQENIARALGTFFNPEQSQDEGHIQGIKDMRRDVMTSIANLLNQ